MGQFILKVEAIHIPADPLLYQTGKDFKGSGNLAAHRKAPTPSPEPPEASYMLDKIKQLPI